MALKSVPTPSSSKRLLSFFRNDTRIGYLLTHINFHRIKLQHRKSNKLSDVHVVDIQKGQLILGGESQDSV